MQGHIISPLLLSNLPELENGSYTSKIKLKKNEFRCFFKNAFVSEYPFWKSVSTAAWNAATFSEQIHLKTTYNKLFEIESNFDFLLNLGIMALIFWTPRLHSLNGNQVRRFFGFLENRKYNFIIFLQSIQFQSIKYFKKK